MQKIIFRYFESITVTLHLIFWTFSFISRFRSRYHNLQITEANSPPCWSCSHVVVPLLSKKNVSTNNLRWKEWKNLLLRFLLVSSVHKHSVKRVRIRSYCGPHFSRILPHSDWIRRSLVFFRLRKTSLQLALTQISRRKVRKCISFENWRNLKLQLSPLKIQRTMFRTK